MISINEITVFLIIQTIILLILSSLIFFFLWWNSRKKLSQHMAAFQDHQEPTPSATIEHYLTTEIKLIEGRFDLLFQDADRQSLNIVEPDWLVLRKKYLELEKELLENTEREDLFWDRLGENLRQILNDCYLVKRLDLKQAMEDAEEEINELKSIMETQNQELENLLTGLDGNNVELEVNSLKDKLTTLSNSHRELSHCIAVLEDENRFLRNQIKGLLEI